MTLRGRVALITGGARIGGVVAAALAREGCRLALTYRNSQARAQASVRSARLLGVTARPYPADLTDAPRVSELLRAIRRDFGRLDVLIHMASRYEAVPFGRLREAQWRQQLDADLGSAYTVAKEAAPLLSRRGGRIIFFSDWVAASGRPRYKGYLPYYVAKRGVQGLTEGLALELAPRVLVNAIAPGPILPPPDMGAAERRRVVRATPLRRWGGAEEIAKAVLFLLRSDFVTGECLRVDGGRHLS